CPSAGCAFRRRQPQELGKEVAAFAPSASSTAFGDQESIPNETSSGHDRRMPWLVRRTVDDVGGTASVTIQALLPGLRTDGRSDRRMLDTWSSCMKLRAESREILSYAAKPQLIC